MANLIEVSQWELGIYQFETEDPVQGGVNGIDNIPTKQLANRTKFLKDAAAAHLIAADPHPQYMTAAESNAAIAAAVAALVNGSPGALDTLNELAAALGNDANFATSVTNALALKAPLASPALTGTPTAPTPVTTDSSTKLATTEFVKNAINGGDHKDSVRFTTTANIVLTGLGIQAGGDWPAALNPGERILVKNQGGVAAHVDNGEYIAAAGVWPRATDADTGAELNSGAIIPVESGTLNADTNWQLTTDGTVVIGTTALTITQMPSQFASNAEILAGVIANKFVSPLGLLAGFLGVGGTSGTDYITIPYRDISTGVRRNLIMQFGLATSGAGGNTTVTYPIAFPNQVQRVYVTPVFGNILNAAGTASNINFAAASTLANTGAGSVGTLIPWLAIGF